VTVAEQLTLPRAHHTKPCTVCASWGTLEATDMFCGAGGSSLGLEAVCCPACGRSLIRITQAINHWDLAVEAHNANFPEADHDVHSVHEIDPRRFRRTPLFWASPECTYHAYTRGRKSNSEEARRSRATFRDIVRFADCHRYDAVIVENVIEAQRWCDKRGHGKKCGCGSSFQAWFKAMTRLGYDGQVVHFNSQFALPTPQSRDRMYVVFWRHGLPAPNLDFRPISWCSGCAAVVRGIQTWKKPAKSSPRSQPGLFEWGRYGPQYIYCCPECTQPVAPAVTGAKTILDWTLPIERFGDKERADNTRERIRYGFVNQGRRQPIAVQVGGNLFERRPGVRVWSVEQPLRTVVGTQTMALVTPAGGQEAAARDAREPMHTVLGSDRLAIVLRYGGQQPAPSAIGAPMSTITAHDREIGLIVQTGGQTGSGRTPTTVDEPVGTVLGENHRMLVQVNRGDKNGNVRSAHDLDEPARTIAGHGELALVELRGDPKRPGGGNQAKTLDETVGAIAANGNHHGLLVYNGVPGFVRDLDDACGTLTARDKQSLLVPYYSTGVARPVGEPLGTVTTIDREALFVPTDAEIDDCLFRMLQWHELLRAQAPHDHLDGRPYQLTARTKDARGRYRELSNEKRVKMIGNMVSAPVATMLGAALVFDTLARAA
jgi:DNA (cytosine-5)-methyltransferase 1